MYKNNKEPTEVSYDNLIYLTNMKEFEQVKDMKSRFYLDSEWDYMLTRNNHFLRLELIENFLCPWCLEKLVFVIDKEEHWQYNSVGTLQCPNGHEY